MGYVGFEKLQAGMMGKGMSREHAAAVAAKVGMRKYGKESFMKAAHSGKKMKYMKHSGAARG